MVRLVKYNIKGPTHVFNAHKKNKGLVNYISTTISVTDAVEHPGNPCSNAHLCMSAIQAVMIKMVLVSV